MNPKQRTPCLFYPSPRVTVAHEGEQLISINVAPAKASDWDVHVPGQEDDAPVRPEQAEQMQERMLEGIHRVQAMVGEAKRLIMNPALAEPPAIAAPTLVVQVIERKPVQAQPEIQATGRSRGPT